MNYQQLLQQLVEDNQKKNQRAAAHDSYFYFRGLQDEIKEVEDELVGGNKELIEFELVDIFWTALNLVERLDRDNIIDKEGLYKKAYKKYAQRLPNIAAGEEPISKDEQDKLWNEAKAKQKKELGL